jgi:hypothetical protein
MFCWKKFLERGSEEAVSGKWGRALLHSWSSSINNYTAVVVVTLVTVKMVL